MGGEPDVDECSVSEVLTPARAINLFAVGAFVVFEALLDLERLGLL